MMHIRNLIYSKE